MFQKQNNLSLIELGQVKASLDIIRIQFIKTYIIQSVFWLSLTNKPVKWSKISTFNYLSW